MTEQSRRGEVTVEQLAEKWKMPVKDLLDQLKKAGVNISGAADLVSREQKQSLMASLKQKHGEKWDPEPVKVTLTRTRVSGIKVQRSSGRKETVSVVQKKRRIYVKKEVEEKLEEIEKQKEAVEKSVTPISSETSEQIQAVKQSIHSKAGKKSQTEVQLEQADRLEEVITPPPQAVEATVVGVKSDKQDKPEKTTTEPKPESKAPIGKKRGPAGDYEDEKSSKVGARTKKKDESKQSRDWRRVKTSLMELEEFQEEEAEGVPHIWRKSRPKIKLGKDVSKNRSKEEARKHSFEKPTGPIIKEVGLPEAITVAELSQKMSVKAAEVIKVLMKLGVMATINQSLDQTTAALVVEEMGHTVKLVKEVTLEDSLHDTTERVLEPRSPVVTIMGHVDHGKTSLLDYIRRTKVAASEAGGITQHIGAYSVKTPRGAITFLDTPGHAAFTAMRARGAKSTDIVVLVVAADDGVMPQTIEAIQHAQAASVPIVVAVNKMDKPGADIERIRSDLSHHNLISEAWGGQVMFVPVSAKVGTGIDALLEAILLQAEILELKAPVDGPAKGVVLEARLDKGRGPVASLLIHSGTLKQGDMLLAGLEYGRIRAMINDLGHPVKEVKPSVPVEVLGLSAVPQAGDEFTVVEDERKAREIAVFRQARSRDVRMSRQRASKLEGLFEQLGQGNVKTLKIVLKADVHGSLEALAHALESLSTNDLKVQVIGQGVGGINETDVNLAMASNAILIGFNVRAEAQARQLAEREALQIYYYSIIYDVVDGVKRALHGLLGPQYQEKVLGIAEVREVFKSAKLGTIAGCMVTEGTVKRGAQLRVVRDSVVVFKGEMGSLRRFKDDVHDVRQGMECGISIKNFGDIKQGDNIEVFEMIEVSREKTEGSNAKIA